MIYFDAYISYLVHFHASRDFFECHEIVEEFWKERGQKEQVWVGLIQIAVGMYHYRGRNTNGAFKSLKSSQNYLKQEDIEKLGLDYQDLMTIIEQQIENISKQKTYADIHLPIIDHSLLERSMQKSNDMGFTWGSPSELNNLQLIHKHTLRDRSQVIAERENNLKNRSE